MIAIVVTLILLEAETRSYPSHTSHFLTMITGFNFDLLVSRDVDDTNNNYPPQGSHPRVW